jgi:hypothetical protein
MMLVKLARNLTLPHLKIKKLRQRRKMKFIGSLYHFINIINYNYLKIIVSLRIKQSKIYLPWKIISTRIALQIIRFGK